MRTLYDVYEEYVEDLAPILWEAGKVNGVHVDNEARLALVDTMTQRIRGVVERSQEFIPDPLFPTKHYKSEPATDRPYRMVEVHSDKVKTCARCGAQHISKGTHTARKGGKAGVPENPCYGADIVLASGSDWEYDVVMPFNPGSDDQLRAYAEMFKHKLGKNWRTDEDTLDAKQVQKFINKYGDKHPIYALALEIRKIRKAKGYAQAWVPDEKGLIYGEFTNVPETFRLSQRRHNFQNVSHREGAEYAEELRRLLVAPPGYQLVEADSSSIEAVFTAKLMSSDSYMALAKQGIHATWALKSLGQEVTKENISWLKNAKEHAELYETKKRTVHGVSYGMGAKLLWESYPHLFKNKKAAQTEIDEFYGFAPDLKEWHIETQKQAHKQGYLQSPWGIRNYYYRVFSYDWAKKAYVLGEDAKAVIAFQPQHANAMFQRENLKLIHAAIGKMGKRGVWFQTAIGHVHDSNGLRVPEDDVEKAGVMLAEVMTRPVKQFDNISIGVQVKSGPNWDAMKVLKI